MSQNEGAVETGEPLVSVIVPAFNAERFIGECLASLVAQAYANTEIIVVDDGSTDGTAELVKNEFTTVRYLYQENSGTCSRPRNAGAKLARGEFIGFFDADDVMQPDCIRSHIDAFADFPSAAFSLVNYQNFASKDNSNIGPAHFQTCKLLAVHTGICAERPRVLIAGRRAREILIEENFASACGIVIRRSVFSGLGGFDEILRASEDFDLAYRASTEGDVAVNLAVGFRRRTHEDNMSHQTARILGEKIRSRAQLAVIEPDSELRRRLQLKLGELHLAVALTPKVFTRSKRLLALRESVALSGKVSVNHMKAVVKIMMGR
jgi:glycosyltransferase involved in cell wall biosynthesis